MGSNAPFADEAYFASHGFGTPPDDVDALLERASRLLRAECPDVDERISDGSLDEDLVSDIACEMVQNVTQVPDAGVGVDSSTQQYSSGPFSMTNTASFSSTAGAMILNKKHRRLLGCSRQKAFMIDPLAGQP